MLIQHFLEQNAAKLPDKVALVSNRQRFTYRRLEAMSNQLAHALRQHGVRRGDRVAIYLNNSMETVVSIFAILKADAVFVTVNRTVKTDKLGFILNNCQATALITDTRALMENFGEVASLRVIVTCGARPSLSGNGHLHGAGTQSVATNGTPAGVEASTGLASLPRVDFESIKAAAPSAPPRTGNIDLDLACLIYTSGTTGESKGVMCDHSNVVFVTQSIAKYLKHTESDIILNVLPLAFSYGLYQLMTTFSVGGTLVLEESFAFPDLILDRLAEEKATGFAGVPTLYSMLLNLEPENRDFSALRYLTNAAAGLPVEHVKRLRQFFPRAELYLMHGLTEVARTMYLPPEQTELRPASSGIAIPGTELWIEDEQGRRVGPGETGELVVRGRNVMRGYWNDPVLTGERFRPGPLPGERVCHSGDLFHTDEEGYFYFVSRKDDIIKSRGEKVAPREVEHVLYAMQGVQDAAVIGIPDPVLGQAVKAFIVAPAGGLTESDVISYCKSRLEYYMVPRRVEFRSELPRTASGKIRRKDLS